MKDELNKDDCLLWLINIISGFTLEDNIEQSFENHGLHLRNRVVIRKALFYNKKPIKRKIMYTKEDEVRKKKSVSKRKNKGGFNINF